MKIIAFVPIRDYFQSRKHIWLKLLIPFLIGVSALVGAFVFEFGGANDINTIFSEFINVQINIVATLISFSVAIITILVSADNKNIEQLKNTQSSDCKHINGKPLSLFQVLLSNIAYNVTVEIIYLILLIAVVLIKALLPLVLLKYFTAACVFFIMHILFVLLESVAQMYLTFWSKKIE